MMSAYLGRKTANKLIIQSSDTVNVVDGNQQNASESETDYIPTHLHHGVFCTTFERGSITFRTNIANQQKDWQ